MLRLQRERRQKFGAGQSIDILLGKTDRQGHRSTATTTLTRLRHRRRPGARPSGAAWSASCWPQGLLAVEGDYGTLVLTEASARGAAPATAGACCAASPSGSRGAKAARAAKAATPRPPADLPAGGRAGVRAAARLARRRRPRSRACPAYVIFHDATLRQIAAEAPTTLAELGTVSGVGENKLAKYGQQILDTLGEPTGQRCCC